jgi:hypothetical protein
MEGLGNDLIIPVFVWRVLGGDETMQGQPISEPVIEKETF